MGDSNTKVYIDGKRAPLRTVDEYANLRLMLEDKDRAAITVNTVAGEETTIPRERVMSVARPTDEAEKVEINPSAFWGFRFTIREFKQADAATLNIPHRENCAVVLAEDMAEAEVVVYDLDENEIVWANPAEPLRSIKRVIKAVRLLAEAKALFDQVHDPEQREQALSKDVEAETAEVAKSIEESNAMTAGAELAHGHKHRSALSEDQQNAMACIDNARPLSEAISAAGREFVLAYLSETVTYGGIDAILNDGTSGSLVGFKGDETFQFQTQGPNATAAGVTLDDIQSVELVPA